VAGRRGRAQNHLVPKLLDNIMWNCLAGPHAKFASGAGNVRRYAPGFSPILGFEDPQAPDFTILSNYCEPGEHFYCDQWTGTPPHGWQVEREALMLKMVWDAPMPPEDAAPDAVRLQPEHFPLALAFAQELNPGPFGPRTPELGEYFGYFDGPRLIAMAGERMEAGSLRELSAVCTHPDFQGRGLARRLSLKLIHRQMIRGLTPFLHVMSANTAARTLYEKMGFRNYLETVVRIVSRIP
jgi:ribosomal protein S18 acetylase RimI-like enzyme